MLPYLTLAAKFDGPQLITQHLSFSTRNQSVRGAAESDSEGPGEWDPPNSLADDSSEIESQFAARAEGNSEVRKRSHSQGGKGGKGAQRLGEGAKEDCKSAERAKVFQRRRELKKTAKSAERAKSFRVAEKVEHFSSSGQTDFRYAVTPERAVSWRSTTKHPSFLFTSSPIFYLFSFSSSLPFVAITMSPPTVSGDAMRCTETMLSDVEEPIHIIMDGATSKTMDMFGELVPMGDVMCCAEKPSYGFYLTYRGHKLNEHVHGLGHL
ncbi:uncharacterized protein FSUBG_482 [Fusarium subglutinans]|uniref:Uncharacterized protein n=1 Tax=Gibberella subglutinans TaxID=42677 RepID=A0A8H5QCF6_GIBSU|nr:uncharacterized protein FSUBG_482 [Fusarium subglutinans]KAF5613870.1 hypothetical protein FSUBG_482 [Fusarium subglutinans]